MEDREKNQLCQARGHNIRGRDLFDNNVSGVMVLCMKLLSYPPTDNDCAYVSTLYIEVVLFYLKSAFFNQKHA